MVRAFAKAVAVAELPVQDPDDPEAFPVTFPVNGPEKAVAVQVPDTVNPPETTSALVDPPSCSFKLPVPLSLIIESDAS